MPAMNANEAVLVARARHAAQDGRARSVRMAAGLSQHEVGGVCRVTGAAVSRWETGERLPRGDAAVRYARLLDRLGLGDTEAQAG
jgi:transcriptional regulator with XRE-family HTH domain